MNLKNNILFLIIAIIIFSSSSCRKHDSYTLSGYIYERCGIPAANKTFAFYQSGGGGGTLGTATTDAIGRFSLSYKELNYTFIKVGIPLNVGYHEYGRIDHSGFDEVVLYDQPSSYLEVSMKAYSAYTNQDTLYIQDYRRVSSPYLLAVPGPFTSKLLYTVPDYKIVGDYYYPVTRTQLSYKINNGDFINILDTLRACDTTRFTVDIR